jgi:hypothetical protein
MTIAEIIANKSELIAIKKGVMKYSDTAINTMIKDVDNVTKAVVLEGTENDAHLSKVIANTYYWLDSHGDVHVKGTFTKSISENKGKIFHFDNHNHSFSAKVGNVKNVTETAVKWRDLNVDKDGSTICVLGESELIEDYNCQVFDAYKNNEINQHSVGMIYVSLQLAVNDENNVEEFKAWNEVFPLLGNPEKATENGYFWIVKEAKLKEYSCVLWDGSNSLTPTLNNKTEAVADTTEKEEPTIEVTRIKRRRNI